MLEVHSILMDDDVRWDILTSQKQQFMYRHYSIWLAHSALTICIILVAFHYRRKGTLKNIQWQKVSFCKQ